MRSMIFLIWLYSGWILAQNPDMLSRKADKLYRDSNFLEAEEQYRKVNGIRPYFDQQFNIGNSLYQQGRLDEAKSAYEKSLGQEGSNEVKKSHALYNLGNTYFAKKEFDKSVEAYKQSLKLNPQDKETKINLAQALQQQRIQQQQQQQQKQQQQEQKQEQQKQNQGQQQEPQKRDPNNKDNSPPEENQSPNNGDLKKEEAEQLLKMVDDKDKKVKEKLQRMNRQKAKKEKDW